MGSLKLAPQPALRPGQNAVIMYYKTKTPSLKAKENVRIAEYGSDNYTHDGSYKPNDGSEGAPLFINFNPSGEADWRLAAIRFDAPSPAQGEEYPNTAIKTSRIIEALSDFEKTSKNDKHKSVIRKIVPKDESSPVHIPVAPPPRAESPKPRRSGLEKKSFWVKPNSVVEYEAGTHTKYNVNSNIQSRDGYCVTMTPDGVFITGGAQGNNVTLWNGSQVISNIPDMKHDHQNHCAILFDDELYVISGNRTDNVESYNI